MLQSIIFTLVLGINSWAAENPVQKDIQRLNLIQANLQALSPYIEEEYRGRLDKIGESVARLKTLLEQNPVHPEIKSLYDDVIFKFIYGRSFKPRIAIGPDPINNPNEYQKKIDQSWNLVDEIAKERQFEEYLSEKTIAIALRQMLLLLGDLRKALTTDTLKERGAPLSEEVGSVLVAASQAFVEAELYRDTPQVFEKVASTVAGPLRNLYPQFQELPELIEEENLPRNAPNASQIAIELMDLNEFLIEKKGLVIP